MTNEEARRQSITYLLPTASEEQVDRLMELAETLDVREEDLFNPEQQELVAEMGRIALDAMGTSAHHYFGWMVKAAAERTKP